MIGSTLIHVFQCGFVIIVLISLVHSSLTQSLQYFWYTFKYLITRYNQALVLPVFQIYEYLVSIHYFSGTMRGFEPSPTTFCSLRYRQYHRSGYSYFANQSTSKVRKWGGPLEVVAAAAATTAICHAKSLMKVPKVT